MDIQGIREVSGKSVTNSSPLILTSARTQKIPVFHMGMRKFSFEVTMTENIDIIQFGDARNFLRRKKKTTDILGILEGI
jgi:hypothetical protein